MSEHEFDEYIQLGLANREVIQLAHNWCAHLEVHQTGGVGMLEASTGLPIGMRTFACKHATGNTIGAMDLRHVALHFYDNNCAGCPHRQGVRLPNLTAIVAERDRVKAVAAEKQRQEEVAAAAALENRQNARLEVRDGAAPPTAGIIDLIAELDAAYSEANHQRLVKLAATVPEQFDSRVQGLLLSLLDVGGDGRSAAAIEALSKTTFSRADLVRYALHVLARHEAVSIAAGIVAEHLDGSQSESIEAALPAILVLASPVRGPFSRDVKPNTVALKKAFALYPAECERVVLALFGSDNESYRVVAAGSWEVLISADGDVGPRLAPAVIESLALRDERLGAIDGARRATVRALSEAFKRRADDIDAAIQEAYSRGVARPSLLDVYAEVCGRPDTRRRGIAAPLDAMQLAFSRLTKALIEPAISVDELRSISSFLRDEAKDQPDLLLENVEVLLGALALLIDRADELKSITSPLALGSPDALAMLEQQSRSTLLGGVLNTLSSLIGLALKTDISRVLPLLTSVIDNAPSGKDTFKSYVVRMLTGAAQNRSAVVDLLPYVYGALTDQSQLVRAAGVKTYGVIAQSGIDDLPPMLTELVLALLADPYVIVHLAVAEVLRELQLPEQYRPTALLSLSQLVAAHARSTERDRYTKLTIQAFCTQHGGPLSVKTTEWLVAVARKMDSDEAVSTLLELRRYRAPDEHWVPVAAEYASNPLLSEYTRLDLLRVLLRSDAPLLARHSTQLQRAILLRLTELPFPRGFGDDDFLDTVVEKFMIGDAWPAARDMLTAAEGHFTQETISRGRRTLTLRQLAAMDVEEATDVRTRLALARSWLDEPTGRRLDGGEAIALRFEGLLAISTLDVEQLLKVSQDIALIAESIEEEVIRVEYRNFARVLGAIRDMQRWREALRSAEVDADRFRKAAVISAKDIAKTPNRVGETGIAGRIATLSDVDEIDTIVEDVLRVRLPIPFSKRQSYPSTPPIGDPMARFPKTPTPITIAFTRFEFEGGPVSDPQVIAPKTIHELALDISISDWPDGAEAIVVDPLSVVPRSYYDMPTFTLTRPSGTPPYHCRLTGRLLLPHAQSLVTGPLEFQYRAYMKPESVLGAISVEGQRNLRLFAYDPAMHPQTGYSDIDRKLLAIRTDVRRARVPESDIEPFMLVMTALGSLAGRALASHLYPGNDWSERRFQADVSDKLRSDPRIGADLEEHPEAAAGTTDLSFKRIRIELKVEATKLVAVEAALSYSNQEAQYVAGSDRRLGVICILDASQKDVAPGTPSNDIGLLTVSPPSGGTGSLMLGVVIIRGNLRKPSDFSR